MAATLRKQYKTDLTDRQWHLVEPHLPAAKPGGRKREVDLRKALNTILYLHKHGCRWAMLPDALLPKSPVYDYFALWRDDGIMERLTQLLREAVRVQEGREA